MPATQNLVHHCPNVKYPDQQTKHIGNPTIKRSSEIVFGFSDDLLDGKQIIQFYSGLNLNQDKATKPQTVQIVRQGEATPYWFKVNPLYYLYTTGVVALSHFYFNPL